MGQTESDINYAYALLSAKAGQSAEAEYYLRLAQKHGEVSPRRMHIYNRTMKGKREKPRKIKRQSKITLRLLARGVDLTPAEGCWRPKIKKLKVISIDARAKALRKDWYARLKRENPTVADKYLAQYKKREGELKSYKSVETWWRSSRGEALLVRRSKPLLENFGIRRVLAKTANKKFGKAWKFVHTSDVFRFIALANEGGDWIELRGSAEKMKLSTEARRKYYKYVKKGRKHDKRIQ